MWWMALTYAFGQSDSVRQDSATQPQKLDLISSEGIQADSLAADSTAEMVKEETEIPDSLKPPFLSDVNIWADYVKPFTQFINGREQYEFGGGITFYDRIQLSGSYGIADLLFAEPSAYFNGTYRAEGNYWRVGADYVAGEGAKTFVGVRYAQSNFSDIAQATLTSSLWDDYLIEYNREFSVNWWELVVGSEATPFKDSNPLLENLVVGWIFRFRTFSSLTQPEVVPVFFVPGYGRAANPYTVHVNLTVRYRLNF
ncbi:MAG TPA: hypothetical protein DCE41_37000 [Cytophagales bacterium]|nr:hypothetical protein [Cytophagales bacterium]HAA21170.1 hypothetical protein [Cytophagales bacterium]HAP60690.1 hypothetical protein [Cytophagales bacterium]